MEEVKNSLEYVYGVGAIIFFGMGYAIFFMNKLRKEEQAEMGKLHTEMREERKENLEVLRDLKDALKSIEVMVKTIL